MSVDDTWTDQVRASALELARIGAQRRRDSDRALRHLLSSALAHGVTVSELAAATDLDEDTVHILTTPAGC